jgi:serine/threonine-protein kinase
MSEIITRLNAALGGRYAIHRELGEGGMATVFLADDLKHERKVALKVLKPELAAVVGADRFLAEIKTTANLQHPHILPLFDSGEADGFLFYVMPYVEGESLRDRLDRERQLPVDQAVRLVTDVAEALHSAHEQGVIHRDIKPANILMSKGRPLVADFGIALAVSAAGSGRLTETGLSMGTPYYMSPEQASADREPSAASDVYALGCVLYEMLVGEPPYTGASAQAVLAKILTEDARSATKARPSIPAHVDAAIRRALEKLPADRFTSAHDFAQALADASFRHGAEAAEAAAEGAGGAGWWKGLAATMTVVAAGFALTAGWALSRPDPPADVARFQIDLPEGSTLRGATWQPLAISHDGSFVVANVRTAEGDQLYRRNLDELEMIPIRGTETVGSFTLSPDGQWLAFNDFTNQQLVKISVDGGPVTTVAPTPGTGTTIGIAGFTWTSAGWIVYSFGSYRGLQRVRDLGGDWVPLTDPPEGERHRSPSPMPDGETILFEIERQGGDSEVAIVRPGTGEYDVLTTGSDPKYVRGGFLLFRREDALWAAPLAADWRSLTQEPFPVVENVGAPYDYSSVSADGTLLHLAGAVNAGAGGRLAVVDLEGRLDVLPLGPRAMTYVSPTWSPDGESVVFESGEQIYTYSTLLNTTPRQITFEGANAYPVYSPDGTQVVFGSARTGTSLFDLFVKDLTGDAPPRSLLTRDGNQFPTDWPSDTLIVFVEGAEGAGDLWILDLSDPGEPEARPYLTSEADLNDAIISPDGRHAAYVARESGGEDVYVRSFPNPGVQTPLDSDGVGRIAAWSQDGMTVYHRKGTDRLMVASRLQREPVVSVASLDTLFNVPNQMLLPLVPRSFHPATERWIMVVSQDAADGSGEAETHLVLVQNFFEELRRRAEGNN